MFPIISVAVHLLVHMITGFTNILFSTLGACYKVDNIGRLTTSVAPKLDCCPRRWLSNLYGGYHCSGFASCFAARSCLPKLFIITQVWFKKIPQTLESSVWTKCQSQFYGQNNQISSICRLLKPRDFHMNRLPSKIQSNVNGSNIFETMEICFVGSSNHWGLIRSGCHLWSSIK